MEKEMFLKSDIELADFAKALSHPARVAIVRILMANSRCTCGENCEGKNCKCGCNCGKLVDQLPMAQSTVSQHIKELKSSGLIELESRKGNYRLNYKKLSEALISFLGLLGQATQVSSACRCGSNCQCGEECHCGEGCDCCKGCTCGDDCHCDENNKCCDDCTCGSKPKCHCCD